MARQKMIKTLEKMVTNGGVLEPAMRDIKPPYSEGYIQSHKIKKTKTWKELTDKYFPDTKLAKKHGELLNAESETVQLGAVKLGYEVTGKVQQVPPPQTNQIVNINFFATPKIKDLTKRLDEAVIESIRNEIKESDTTLQNK